MVADSEVMHRIRPFVGLSKSYKLGQVRIKDKTARDLERSSQRMICPSALLLDSGSLRHSPSSNCHRACLREVTKDRVPTIRRPE